MRGSKHVCRFEKCRKINPGVYECPFCREKFKMPETDMSHVLQVLHDKTHATA